MLRSLLGRSDFFSHTCIYRGKLAVWGVRSGYLAVEASEHGRDGCGEGDDLEPPGSGLGRGVAARESEEDAASAARHAQEAPATDERLETASTLKPPCRLVDLAGHLSTFHVRICSVVWAKRLHRSFTGVSYRWDYNST